MYLQITTRCNMSCEHCGMNCTNKGEDMSMEVLKAALDHGISDYPFIGGGEPTIHPKFWEMFIEVWSNKRVEQVGIITNGSMTETSLKLATLAKKEVIFCELSQDNYHDPIDVEVYHAFEKIGAIRNVSGSEVNAGRCDFGTDNGCICPDLIVKPNGDIYLCGCDDAPLIGTVFDETLNIPEYSCIKEMKEEEAA